MVDQRGPKLISLVCEILKSGDEVAIDSMILSVQALKHRIDLGKRLEVLEAQADALSAPPNPIPRNKKGLRLIQGRG